MEQWEHEVFGHVTQPPGFRLDAKHRQQFRACEDAVNAKLAQPQATHLHHDHEIARPATLTRNRISVTYDGSNDRPTTHPELN